jgi:hypothetical protein
MGINTFITDISSGLKAKVSNANSTEENALVVATRPLKTLTNKVLFFSNPTHGIDMNKSPGTAGVTIDIHNGIDNVYWTASAITGVLRWDFNNNTQAHTGTYSIDGSATINTDESQYAKGSNQDLTGYVSLSGWIYITGWPVTGTKKVQIYGWDVGVGLVGNIVNIGDYVNTLVFNGWLRFIIPLSDMGLTEKTIDSIRIKTISLGAGAAPSYHLDDIQILETELPIEYIVEPSDDTWLHVDQINITMADALNTTLTDNSMFNLSYDKFLALGNLNVGILFQKVCENDVIWSSTFHNLLDFLQIPNTNILTTGCDGTNTWFSLSQNFASPVLLKSESKDKLSFIIRDDMTGLLRFRIGVSCREEYRDGCK